MLFNFNYKMKYIILIFSLIVLLVSYNKKGKTESKTEFKTNKKIVFEKQKSIELPLMDSVFFTPYGGYDYKIIDGVKTFIVYRYDVDKIVFYDLDKRKIYNEIKLRNNYLYSFKYLNKDSIFLFYVNQLDPNNYVDSTQLQLVDFKGKIKENFVYNNKNIWKRDNLPLNEDSAFYPSLLGSNLNIFNNENVFLLLDRQNEYNIGTGNFFKNKSPIVAYYNIKSKKLIESKKIWYPYIKEGNYYPSDFNIINCGISSDNLPLIRFFYSSALYKWDYKNDVVYKYELKSRLVDSIPPLDYETRSSANNVEAMYASISYDKYNEIYYSVVYFSQEIYGNYWWSLIISDKNFNYIGEILKPKINSFMPVFTKDYLITAYSSKKGFFNVDFYKIKFEDVNYDDYINSFKQFLKNKKDSINKLVCDITGVDNSSINKAPIINYLNKYMKIKDKKYAVVSIYTNQGCPSCKDKVTQFISENAYTLNKVPLYLNIVSDNYNGAREYIKTKGILKFNNIYIDTTNTYVLFDNFGNKNPRLTLVSENKIISDTIYNPKDINEKLIPRILSHTGLSKND